jgi:hypothetical protein
VDPGWTALGFQHDELVSSFDFNIKLRRYMWVAGGGGDGSVGPGGGTLAPHLSRDHPRSKAWRCHTMKPTLNAPGTKRFKKANDKLLSVLLQCCFQVQVAAVHLGDGAGYAAPGGGGGALGAHAAVRGHAD